jgi:inosose dehydratase
MQDRIPRREFLLGLRAVGAAAAVASVPGRVIWPTRALYPPRDLSCFDKPIPPAAAEIRTGLAAVTWGENWRQAIDDIAASGFRGVRFQANSMRGFGSSGKLRDSLEERQIKLVALSLEGVRLEPMREAEEVARHTGLAKFIHEVGGMYLEVTDHRPQQCLVGSEDYVRRGRLLTQIGKRTADLGITLGYHNHPGQRLKEVDQILEAADPRCVKLVLDVAGYFQAGGDPAWAIEKYKDRLLFLHIEDVEKLPDNSKHSCRFVEPGREQVNLPTVFNRLGDVKFRGWVVVELERVADASHTLKEAAIVAKKFLEERLGLTV